MHYNEVMHELGDWEQPLNQYNYSPDFRLSSYIKSYCLLTNEFACSKSNEWYILPDNSSYMIFYLLEKGNERIPSLRVIGPRTSHIQISRQYRHLTFMVTFKPGALYQLCQFPQSELVDQAVDAQLLFDWCSDALINRLTIYAEKLSVVGLISAFEAAVFKQLQSSIYIDPIIRSLSRVDLFSEMNVNSIARKLGVSDRHLRNMTRKYIGHSPKLMLQIERFTKSLTLTNEKRRWAEIAYETGYFDQSHMIAENQKMVGQSPEKMFS